MANNHLQELLLNSSIFKPLDDLINKNNKINISNLKTTEKAYILSYLFNKYNKKIFYITDNNLTINQISENLLFFIEQNNINTFPDLNILPYENVYPFIDIIISRVKTLYNIAYNSKKIYLTNTKAITNKIINKSDFLSNIIKLNINETIPLRK